VCGTVYESHTQVYINIEMLPFWIRNILVLEQTQPTPSRWKVCKNNPTIHDVGLAILCMDAVFEGKMRLAYQKGSLA